MRFWSGDEIKMRDTRVGFMERVQRKQRLNLGLNTVLAVVYKARHTHSSQRTLKPDSMKRHWHNV